MAEQLDLEVGQLHEQLEAVCVSPIPPDANPSKITKTNRPILGSLFQFKLTEIFLIRGISRGYKFHLGTEIQKFGKFDDLVFKYRVSTGDQRQWRYKFVQAKHKLDEENCKISSQNLLHTDNGNFSIAKYFKSYSKDIINGSEIQHPEAIDDVVICTNINLDEDDLKRNGVELVPRNNLLDNMLSFEKLPNGKIPLQYKLKNTKVLREKLKENCPIYCLSKIFIENKHPNNVIDLNNEISQKYLQALFNERVIHISQTFHHDFVYGRNLLRSASELRRILKDFSVRHLWEGNWRKFTFQSKNWPITYGSQLLPEPNCVTEAEIDGFLDKFVLVVNSPNENELDDFMKEELGKYYNLLVSDPQSGFVFRKLLDWFKNPESRWMSSDEGKRILEEGRAKIEQFRCEITISYENPLIEFVKFNEEVINATAEKIKPFLTSNSEGQIKCISTEWPDFTAIKVVSSIKTLSDFKCSDSFLVVSSKRFEKLDERERLKTIFSDESAHHLLVIVCEEQVAFSFDRYVNLATANKENKKILLVAEKGMIADHLHLVIHDDRVSYGELHDESQAAILSKKISFQGKDLPVRDLITPDRHDNVLLNSFSMKELLSKSQVTVPSFNESSRLEQSIYIKRRMTLPLRMDDTFLDKLSKELKCPASELQRKLMVDAKGNFQWLTDDHQNKSEIWNKIRKVAEANGGGTEKPVISDDDLILDQTMMNGQAIIISGMAGTGKTTILSYYYREIKKTKPDNWVIRINLADNFKVLTEFNANLTNLTSAIDFFTDSLPAIVNHSPFARSLLRHRLETSDRIVLMLDGFDEISGQLQEKVIRLLSIVQTHVAQLFITTRNHLNDKLQNQLFHFAYTLENFNQNDQIDYLTDYWICNLGKLAIQETLPTNYKSLTQTFAESVVNRASKTLEGEEISIIGIPLQCRIVAECFQSELQRVIETHKQGILVEDETQILAEEKFDLVSMYRRLMETKRQVFRGEKANNASNSNQIVDYAIECLIKKIESHLTRLAMETMFRDPEKVKILCPPQMHHQTKLERDAEEKCITEFGLKFGLTFQNEENMEVQFLHRTFAEYLVAKYFYEGFILEDESHNEILKKRPARQLIFQVMREDDHDHYNGIRVFLDFMLKEIVLDSENWRNIIDQRQIKQLPYRLKTFVNDISNQQDCRPLGDAIVGKHTNIFKFICDCIDVMFDSTKVRNIMNSVLLYIGTRYKGFKSFYKQNSQVFQRYIGYYMDHADTNVVEHVLEEMLYRPLYFNKDVLNEKYSKWFHENKTKVVKLVLEFFVKHKIILKPILTTSRKKDDYPENVLHFLIFNECYNNQLKQWLELLSFVYSEDNLFVKLFKDTFNIIYYGFHLTDSGRRWVEGRIENTLKILRDIGRNKVLEGISRLILIREPQAFRNFYRDSLEKDETQVIPATLHILLVRDPYRMTRLHRAVFYEDTETVDHLLDCIRKSLSPAEINPQVNRMAQEVMNNVMLQNDEGFTPFYVATAFLNEELCKKILIFFKQVLRTDQLEKYLTSEKKGFIYGALWDAIKYQKLKMFQMILATFKHVFGQDHLLEMLSSTNAANDFGTEVFNTCRDTEFFKAMTDVILTDDAKGLEKLNDLFFQNKHSILSLEYVDKQTFKNMLMLKGSDDWCLRLLQMNFCTAFYLLASPPCELLCNFEEEQLLNFLKLITQSRLEKHEIRRVGREFVNYWDRLLNVEWWKFKLDDWTLMEVLIHFLSLAFGSIQGNHINELFFNDEGIKIIIWSLLQYGQNSLVNGIFVHLTDEIHKYNEIKLHVMRKLPKMIQDVMEPIIVYPIEPYSEWSRIKIMDYFMDHVHLLIGANGQDYSELATLIDSILIKYNTREIKNSSIWSEYFLHFDDKRRILPPFVPSFSTNFWIENTKERSSRVCAFLKYVSEKLGSCKVKELLTHTHGSGTATSVIFLLAMKKHDSLVKVMLDHLNEEDR